VLSGAVELIQRAVLEVPDVELARLEGGTVRLHALAGKPLVLNLWATWCPPCRRELPALAAAQAQHTDVTFVFANQGEAAAAVGRHLRDSALALHNVVLDPNSRVSQATGARGLPTTLFFDARGRLVDVHVGELTRAGLAQKLQHFASAPAPAAATHP
jgi:thiol-disulfide isomerase/thioredoxin